MTGPDSSSPDLLTLADASTAQIVLRQPRRRFLEPFVGRARSAAQAAREAGVTVEQMSYRVGSMARAGLLREVERRPRAGREIIVYRAPADIRAPLMVLDEGDVRDFFRTVDEPMRELYLDALARRAGQAGLGDWVVRLYRDEADRIRVDLSPAGGSWDPALLLDQAAPAVLLHWVPLALTPADAKSLQHELASVLERYGRFVPGPGARPDHVLGLFLTPLS